MGADRRCSFCGHAAGEYIDAATRPDESTLDRLRSMGANEEALRRMLERQPEKLVRLVMPGPRDLAICDFCTGLYSDTVARELRSD